VFAGVVTAVPPGTVIVDGTGLGEPIVLVEPVEKAWFETGKPTEEFAEEEKLAEEPVARETPGVAVRVMVLVMVTTMVVVESMFEEVAVDGT
jgi:hypothetical protein